MGFLDDLKDKAAQFGEKAKQGFAAAKDKAAGPVDDVEERLDHDEESAVEGAEASDAAPVADPLDPAVEPVVEPMVEPADGTEYPLESTPEDEPIEPVDVTEDPLEPRSDRPG